MRIRLTWLRRWARNLSGFFRTRRGARTNPPTLAAAVAALRAGGTTVTPCGDDFQHWQMGDFQMTEAELIHLAVSQGVISDR